MEYCIGPIDIEELTLTVLSSRNNTLPGPSGQTGAFYKFFWPELKYLVHHTVCDFESGNMPVNLKRSVSLLAPKKGKHCRIISNLKGDT